MRDLPAAPASATAGAWIDQVAEQLEAQGIALGQGCWNTLDEAHWLVLGALGLPLDIDPSRAFGGGPVPAELGQTLQDAVHQRLVLRRPTAYILNEAWLGGLAFDADERAIIPRSFLAFPLLDGDISLDHVDVPQVLELCTGGGALAVIAARAYPTSQVVATDLSPDALALAAQNIGRHGLQNRIALHCGDLFQALPADAGPFDLIICNPPYVPDHRAEEFPPEFAAEPSMAHFSGPMGTDIIRQFLQDLPRHLAPGGQALLEVGREAHAVDPLLDLLPQGMVYDWWDSPAQDSAMLYICAP